MRKTLSIIGIVLGLCCLAVLANTDHKESEGNSFWFPEIMNYFSKEQEIMLNERQKKILEMELLPTEYEELTTIQRRGIKAIEEFMCYLDEKYPEETFEYEHYYLPHTDMNERVEVSSSIGQITAYRQKQHGKWVYLDNYAVRRETIQFAESFEKELDKEFGKGNWIMHPTFKFPDEVFEKGMKHRCWLDFSVYLRQSSVTDLNASADKLNDFLMNSDKYITMGVDYMVVSDKDFQGNKDLGMRTWIDTVGCMIYEDRHVHTY